MRIQKLIVKDDVLMLVLFGDLHFGHKNCDTRMIGNVIDFIAENDCYWVGGGDYGDAIIPTDRRFDFRSLDEEFNTPQKQYRKIKEMFQPIKHKCLGLLDGNHDIIHWKKHQQNYVEEISADLGVPYLTISAYLRFHFRKYKTDFDAYLHHGWTGSRTKGGKIERVYDLESVFPFIDLYAMFHIHDLGVADKQAKLYVDENEQIRDRMSWYVFGGGFLRGYVKDQVSYVEEKTYRPTVLGSPVLTIKPRRGRGTVNFDLEYSEVR